ncbi:hypothetical protein EZS27_024573 [termite gut metagenome]|uniref:Uncharacterized protein n=1 Tax=termite gut metagenome TaxID=433724 RepID=A0A5J4R0M7_9ZZZZ
MAIVTLMVINVLVVVTVPMSDRLLSVKGAVGPVAKLAFSTVPDKAAPFIFNVFPAWRVNVPLPAGTGASFRLTSVTANVPPPKGFS